MAACTARCGSFQLLPDSTKANPVSLNDFCLENVGCPRFSLGSRCRCYREPSQAEQSLENGRVIVTPGIIPAGRPTSVCQHIAALAIRRETQSEGSGYEATSGSAMCARSTIVYIDEVSRLSLREK